MREISAGIFQLDADESALLLGQIAPHDREKGSAYVRPGTFPDALLAAEAEAMGLSGFHEDPDA